MNDTNKRNLQYFKNASMDGLYADMEDWQNTNQKRLMSTSILKDGDMFCCVALSNPSEVVICDGAYGQAKVDAVGRLKVNTATKGV